MKRLSLSPSRHLKRIGALRNEKRIITKFADTFGLVYFGFVSQHDDEHRIVHGLTLSPHHRDEHYCIGTYENYDVIYVERSDTVKLDAKKAQPRRWHIVTFDLKTTRDIPHLLVSVPEHRDSLQWQFNTKFPTKRLLNLGYTQPYSHDFLANYQVYAKPADIVAVENIVTPQVASMLTEHFNGLSFEISRQVLYVYSEHSRVSVNLLETILKNGRWLAETIDKSATATASSRDI